MRGLEGNKCPPRDGGSGSHEFLYHTGEARVPIRRDDQFLRTTWKASDFEAETFGEGVEVELDLIEKDLLPRSLDLAEPDLICAKPLPEVMSRQSTSAAQQLLDDQSKS